MENERLQQRVAQLRVQSQAIDGTSEGPFQPSESFSSVDTARPSFDPAALVPDAEEDGPRKKVRLKHRSLEPFDLNRHTDQANSCRAARLFHLRQDRLTRVAKGRCYRSVFLPSSGLTRCRRALMVRRPCATHAGCGGRRSQRRQVTKARQRPRVKPAGRA